MRSAWGTALVLALAGCGGTARQLEVGDVTTPGPDEGLIVLVVDAPVTTMDFCRPGYGLPCFRAGPFRGRDTVRVVVAPAGPFCMTRMAIEASAVSASVLEPDEPSPCVDVRAGAVTYPGELLIRPRPSQTTLGTTGVGLRVDEPHLRALLARDFPDLEATPLVHAAWR